MTKLKDLTGKRFGRLTVLGVGERSHDGRFRWKCVCDCGNESNVYASELTSGRTSSCGCYQRDRASATFRSHGMTGTRIYRIWSNMRQRCENPKGDSYSLYGAKGITVCDEWHDFQRFYEWAMTTGYSDSLSIDRKDGAKGYSPDNCRWATPQEQTDNRKCCRYVTYNGKSQTIKAWAKETGIHYHTLLARFDRGWSTERALTITPTDYRKHKGGKQVG